MKNRTLELYSFAVKLNGSCEFKETGRRWCKAPERTENYQTLRNMLETWENVTAIQVRKVTPRY